jgi:hypothetical protein
MFLLFSFNFSHFKVFQIFQKHKKKLDNFQNYKICLQKGRNEIFMPKESFKELFQSPSRNKFSIVSR